MYPTEYQDDVRRILMNGWGNMRWSETERFINKARFEEHTKCEVCGDERWVFSCPKPIDDGMAFLCILAAIPTFELSLLPFLLVKKYYVCLWGHTFD